MPYSLKKVSPSLSTRHIVKVLQVPSAQCTDNAYVQFLSSHKCLGSKSFTEPIDDFEWADKCIYNIDDFYMTHIELKSLDMFISDKKEKQLKKVSEGFVRGWLFDSVIEMFIHILLNGIDDTYLIRSFYVQIAAKTKDVSDCVARFPSISYETLGTILIPCCLHQVHWVLIVVKVWEKQIIFLDLYTNRSKSFRASVKVVENTLKSVAWKCFSMEFSIFHSACTPTSHRCS